MTMRGVDEEDDVVVAWGNVGEVDVECEGFVCWDVPSDQRQPVPRHARQLDVEPVHPIQEAFIPPQDVGPAICPDGGFVGLGDDEPCGYLEGET